MTKADLVAHMAAKAGVSKRQAQMALEAFIDAVTKTIKKGEGLTITGFGTFSLSHRAARMGVNPRNPSQKLQIKATKVPRFKAGKTLKEAVR